MKALFKIFFFSVFTLCSLFSTSQNLVPNPSFESYSTCPDDIGEINRCTSWKNCSDNINGTPDYYNPCANLSTPIAGTPYNVEGYQLPHTGNSYAGILCYETNFPNWREFIGITLQTPLVVGQKYYISFFASLSLEYSNINMNTAIDKLGLKFTTINYDTINLSSVSNSSHILSNGFITDTLGWTKVSGSFIADSAYSFLMIGNFYDDANTNKIRYGGTPDSNSYYFIDDVCVSTDSLFSYQWTGVEEKKNSENISIYPNPFINEIQIENSSQKKLENVIIYDITGNVVYKKEFNNNTKIYSLDDLSSINEGIYFIQLNYSEEKNVTYKLIKTK